MPPITFKSFELQEREHSPNAVLGVTEDGKRLFITAPASALGKQLGDQFAKQIRGALERENLKFYIKEHLHSKIECPNCHHIQEHSFPMSGKLFCAGCGEFLDEAIN
jgi:ribosomal protein S27E